MINMSMFSGCSRTKKPALFVCKPQYGVESSKSKVELALTQAPSTDKVRTPVWTAFITHHITSPSWMRRSGGSAKTVYLLDLQRFIFTNEYSPQLGPGGEHELRFKSSDCQSSHLCDCRVRLMVYQTPPDSWTPSMIWLDLQPGKGSNDIHELRHYDLTNVKWYRK